MKVLLTGVLPWSVWSIARRLAQGGHDITLVGAVPEPDKKPTGVHHVKMNLTESETTRYIIAGGFEVILFFYACQCEDLREYGSVQGKQLDVLFDILHGAENTGTHRFILVTDQRVFGERQSPEETETPLPDSATGIMIRAAESCVSCGKSDNIKTLIVRTTSLYTEDDPTSFFAAAHNCAHNHQELLLNGDQDTPCDFLHAEDFGVFLEYAVSMELEGIVHAPQGVPSTYGKVVEELQHILPDLSVSYTKQGGKSASLKGSTASALGWVPRHDFRQEVEEICRDRVTEKKERRKNPHQKGWQTVLKWAEVFLLALLVIWLDLRSENNAILSSVDYRLLFVAAMGIIHGRAAGTVSAVLVCLWYCASFVLKGNSPGDLLYNTDHWLPISVYILCGSFFGYLQDRQRMKNELLRQEQEEISREKDFVENIYQQTYEDRNQMKKQIYHYRDSYGRIYQITRELDSLQPVQVFLSTLHVMESTLQNNSIAIYECKPESSYIRLVVRSREMRKLPKSINLNDYMPMYEMLREGKLFANHNLLSGYPVYAIPVMEGNNITAILMLWNVSFDQQSMYMENLLSVVAGLVQSALSRAIQYHRQLGDLYIEGTHILTAEAFRSALGVYQNIRQRRMGEYVLVRLQTDREMEPEVLDRYVGKLVRSTDLVGQLDNGSYCVLFPQASVERMPAISARFNSYGIKCEVLSEEPGVA